MRERLCRCLVAVVIAVSAVACADGRTVARQPKAADTLWLLARNASDDAVHASDTEASLRERYDSANVALAWIQVGEGDSMRGAVVYGGDPARRLEIIWADSTAMSKPATVSVAGRASQWRIFPGVTLGTRLLDLEAVNGRPFDLAGFFWDYPGGVTDWRGGRLDSLWGQSLSDRRKVWISLNVDDGHDAALADQVMGDHQYSSSLPAMRSLNPYVYKMSITPR
jgi:hypothetical protein